MPALSKEGITLTPQEYGQIAKDDYCLGLIPDFQGLLPKSNEAGVPIFAIRNAEIRETGPVLNNAIERRDRFKALFEDITSKISNALEHA